MGEIHKLTKDGITLFPATTTDAVVHPQVRAAVSTLLQNIMYLHYFQLQVVKEVLSIHFKELYHFFLIN